MILFPLPLYVHKTKIEREKLQFIKMSKKNYFQEFQFSEFPDFRKKVDFQLFENAADIRKSESAYDLRKSLAWDSAFFNSPGVLEPEELFETLNIQVPDKGLDMNRQRDHELKESARPNGSDDMRKSLAWDSAFFTSAGVLDAEELSILNRGFKRLDSGLLPGVEEAIWQSAESNSTINTDGFSLASLEIDLFDDLRASIRTPQDVSSNGRKGRRNGCSSKNSDVSSQMQHAGSTGKSIPSSSHKPPKISTHANSSPIVPSKRPIQVKTDKATKSATGKKTPLQKKMCVRESSNMLSSSTLSMKSPSSILPTARNEHFGGSRSNPKRRIDPQMAVSVSSFTTLSKYSLRKNTELMSSSDSLCFRPCSRHENKETKFSNPQINGVSMSTSPSLTNVKPSGLRVPSPKMGYFDTEKSFGGVQNGGLNFYSSLQGTFLNSGSGIPSVNGSANRPRSGKNRLVGSLSKSGTKDEGKMCSREKEQAFKEHGFMKAHHLGEYNKENVSGLGNKVDYLSQRMGALNFSKDFITPVKGHKKQP